MIDHTTQLLIAFGIRFIFGATFIAWRWTRRFRIAQRLARHGRMMLANAKHTMKLVREAKKVLLQSKDAPEGANWRHT